MAGQEILRPILFFLTLEQCIYSVFITQLVLSQGKCLQQNTFFHTVNDVPVTCRPQNGAEIASYVSRSTPECCSYCLQVMNCTMVALSKQRRLCLLYDDVTVPLTVCLPNDKWYKWMQRESTATVAVTDYMPSVMTTKEASGAVSLSSSSSGTTDFCLNGGVLTADGNGCSCRGGYMGNRCERLMEDCSEHPLPPPTASADNPVLAWPRLSPHPLPVQCSKEGHTFIQMRSITGDPVDFDRDWQDYEDGFGNLVNLWMGLRSLYLFTNSKQYDLVIFLKTRNRSKVYTLKYRNFYLTDNVTFAASLGPLDGNSPIGDHLHDMNGQPFSTRDNDNDNDAGRNCARDYGGGWWFNACAETNFNGVLTGTGTWSGAWNEMFWLGLGNTVPDKYSLRLVPSGN